MKTNQQVRPDPRAFLAAAVAAVTLLLMGCFDDPAHTSLYQSDEIPLSVETWQQGTATLFEATGAISDHGDVDGNAIVLGEGAVWAGHRILHGLKGDVSITVEAYASTVEGIIAEGTYLVVGGTGRYSGVSGAGKYSARRDATGRIVETYCGCCNGRFEPAGQVRERPLTDPQ